MMKLDRISIRRRLQVLMAIVLIGFVALSASSLYTLRGQLFVDKQEKTRSLVQTAISIVSTFHGRQARGELSDAAARAGALEALRGLRYDGENYFWVNDMTPTMVMHPMKPELAGKALAEVRDPNGVPLFQRMVEVVRADGGGVVEYHWPKPGAEQPVPKVSYVGGFAPWNWVVGTGVYVDDIDHTFASVAMVQGLKMAVLLGVLVGVVFLIRQSIVCPLRVITEAMSRIAEGDGDLTQRLPQDGRDEISELARGFNRFTDRIDRTMCKVSDLTARLATASEELSMTARANSETIGQQGDETRQVATAMTEMSATVREIAASAESAAGAANETNRHAREGQARVGDVKTAIAELVSGVDDTAAVVTQLHSKSEAIGGVLDVIRGVAEQTNLLALNAAIEAARAGEQGRGFSVVADEVRTLASRTQASTREIQEMIEQLQAGSSHAVEAMERSRVTTGSTLEKAEQAGASLEEIVAAVGTIQDRNTQVAGAAEQQASAAQQIDRSIAAISHLAGRTAENADHASQAANELAGLGEGLRELVMQFTTSARH